MSKPISIVLQEIKDQIVLICNNSNLPIAILDLLLKDLYNEIHNLASEQLRVDEQNYQIFLKSQSDNIVE